MPHSGQEGGGVLPNGGGREQRERLPSSLPLCFPPLTPFLSFKTFPPLQFSSPLSHFQKLFPPLLFKNSLPSLLQLRQRGAGQQHAHGKQGTPSQGSLRCSHAPALLPTPDGLGQRHAHGGNGVYTILRCFLFFFLFFYFYRDPKMGYNRIHLATMS